MATSAVVGEAHGPALGALNMAGLVDLDSAFAMSVVVTPSRSSCSGVGVPLAAAVPTSLLVVGISSAAAVNRLLEPRIMLVGFAVLMVAAGVAMMREPTDSGGDCALPGGGVNWRGCLPKAIGIGVGVGFLTGLFGVGGGFLLIPALVLLLGVPMKAAIGTSLVIVVINSLAGFGAHAGDATLDLPIAAAFTGAAVLASLAAARFASRLPADRLRRWFAYFVLAVAVFVAIQALLNPAAAG